MSLLERAIGYFSPKTAEDRQASRVRTQVRDELARIQTEQIRGLAASAGSQDCGDIQETRHRGASRAMRWARSWLAQLGSGRSDLPETERKTLQARSRDAFRNYTLARAAITRVRSNVIGTGLIPHASVDAAALGISEEEADDLNQIIDREFKLWAEQPTECDAEATLDFYGLQSLTLVSALLSGDCLALTPFRERMGGVYALKVQLVEADRISNPDNAPNTARLCDGVELDDMGAPISYYVRNTHPGDTTATVMPKWERHEAFGAETGRRRSMLVFNEKDRPGQVRGVPFLAPILEPLRKLEQWSQAELTAAVVSSLFTVFITRTADGAQVDENGDPLPPIESTDSRGNISLGAGAVWDLEPGEKPEFADPARPNGRYDPFWTAFVKQIGAALELPADELLLKYDSSYSAARAAMLQAFRMYTQRRWWQVQLFGAPVRGIWFDEAVARGRIPTSNYADPVRRAAYQAAIWVGPARGSMDELQEAQAVTERINNGTSNEMVECAAVAGESWSQIYAQRRREIAQRRKDGMPIDQRGSVPVIAKGKPPAAPAPAPEPIEEDQ